MNVGKKGTGKMGTEKKHRKNGHRKKENKLKTRIKGHTSEKDRNTVTQ